MLDVPTIVEAPPPPASPLLLDSSLITPLMVSEYSLWFINGPDFYLQNAYLLPADKDFGSYTRMNTPLTQAHIRRHLVGQHTISLPTLNRVTNCGIWFALDADYDGSDKHLDLIAEAMREDGLFPAREASRRGGHLWILSSDPIPARQSRIYLYNLMDRLGYKIRGVRGNKDGIEIFPKQEVLAENKMGSALRAPLGIHRKEVMQRFWFTDAEPDLKAQFAYLRRLPRCTRAKLDDLTMGIDMPTDLLPHPRAARTTPFPQDDFDIRDYTTPPRNSRAKDYFVQCPSCAAGGGDNDGDNLHITHKGDRWLFHCFVGCSFTDIKNACLR
jgi:hypothetical protein